MSIYLSIYLVSCLPSILELAPPLSSTPYVIIVKKLNSLKHLVRTTVAESDN